MAEHGTDGWDETPLDATVRTARGSHMAPEGDGADPCDRTQVVSPARQGADPHVPSGQVPYGNAQQADPYAGAATDPYARAGAAGSQADPYARQEPPTHADPYARTGAAGFQTDAYAQRRPVDAPPQQPAYGEDEEGGGAVISHRADLRWVKTAATIVIALLGVLVVVAITSCVMGGGKTVADAGSNAVGSSDLGSNSSKEPSGGSSSSSSSSDAPTSKDDSSSSSSDSADTSASTKGAEIGSSIGSAVGSAAGNVADKLGSVDTSGIQEQLGSAADSLGSAASSIAGAAGDLIGQLTSN